MSDIENESSDKARELLTRRADVVRSRLLRRIDVLDQRRHELSRNVNHLASVARSAFPVALRVAVVFSVGVVILMAAARVRRRRALW